MLPSDSVATISLSLFPSFVLPQDLELEDAVGARMGLCSRD